MCGEVVVTAVTTNEPFRVVKGAGKSFTAIRLPTVMPWASAKVRVAVVVVVTALVTAMVPTPKAKLSPVPAVITLAVELCRVVLLMNLPVPSPPRLTRARSTAEDLRGVKKNLKPYACSHAWDMIVPALPVRYLAGSRYGLSLLSGLNGKAEAWLATLAAFPTVPITHGARIRLACGGLEGGGV